MRFEVLRRTIAARRRSLVGWGAGIVGLLVLIVLAYPAIRDQDAYSDLLDDYPDFVKEILGLGSGLDITSPAGYLNSQVLTNMLPLIFLIFLIAFATRETAGEEQDGRMDLALAHPISRERYLLEKVAAMLVGGFVLAVVAAVSLLAPAPLIDMDISFNGLVGAVMSVFLLSLVFAALAFAIAAITGRRAVALGMAAGVGVALYILWGLAALIDAFTATRFVNPFFWGLAGDPILDGLQVGNALLLMGEVAVLIAIAVWGFRRRDLKV